MLLERFFLHMWTLLDERIHMSNGHFFKSWNWFSFKKFIEIHWIYLPQCIYTQWQPSTAAIVSFDTIIVYLLCTEMCWQPPAAAHVIPLFAARPSLNYKSWRDFNLPHRPWHSFSFPCFQNSTCSSAPIKWANILEIQDFWNFFDANRTDTRLSPLIYVTFKSLRHSLLDGHFSKSWNL